MISWIRCGTLAWLVVICCGCRMGVPIHVWQPPQLTSTVGKRIALQAVVGPEETTKPIREKLLAMVPSDQGRKVTIVDSESLKNDSMVRLASATDHDLSDVALATVGPRHDVDFLLRGEILVPITGSQHQEQLKSNVARPGEENRPGSVDSGLATDEPENPRMILSWRLTGIGEDPAAFGQPLAVDLESALDRYPDLAIMEDTDEILTSAAARETFRLFTPSIERERVQLAIPYATFGSRDVRRGNIAAMSGKWAEAARIWEDVVKRHPLQAAAVHNLALATAAGQDFSRAKQLARQSIRLRPLPHYKQTLVWIELRQRDYHESFNLPDPPEGWFGTRSQPN